MTLLSVSQIARRTGLTVRALHHYEALGLLRPAARSGAGYRLYGEAELRRLQHIVSLKALGLTLAQIGDSLAAATPSLSEALHAQVRHLRETIAQQHALLGQLEQLARRLDAGEAVDVDTLLSSIEASTLMEKYLTPDQLAAVRQRGDQLGPQRIAEVEQAWPAVIAGMQAAMQLGRDPADAELRPIARKWRALVREFTGGDAAIQHGLNRMFEQEPTTMQQKTGIDPALREYACRAIAALPAED